MFCPNCGTEIENSAKFCTECGYNLISVKVPEAPAPEVAREAPASPSQPVINVYTQAPEPPKPVEKPRKTFSAVPIVMGVLTTLILIGMAVGLGNDFYVSRYGSITILALVFIIVGFVKSLVGMIKFRHEKIKPYYVVFFIFFCVAFTALFVLLGVGAGLSSAADEVSAYASELV